MSLSNCSLNQKQKNSKFLFSKKKKRFLKKLCFQWLNNQILLNNQMFNNQKLNNFNSNIQTITFRIHNSKYKMKIRLLTILFSKQMNTQKRVEFNNKNYYQIFKYYTYNSKQFKLVNNKSMNSFHPIKMTYQIMRKKKVS